MTKPVAKGGRPLPDMDESSLTFLGLNQPTIFLQCEMFQYTVEAHNNGEGIVNVLREDSSPLQNKNISVG